MCFKVRVSSVVKVRISSVVNVRISSVVKVRISSVVKVRVKFKNRFYDLVAVPACDHAAEASTTRFMTKNAKTARHKLTLQRFFFLETSTVTNSANVVLRSFP